ILSFVASFNCSTEDPNFEILFANFQMLPIIPITPAIITRSISIIIHSFHYFLFIYLFAGFGSEVLLFPVTFKYGLGFNCELYPAKFPVVSNSTCKWILYMPFGVFPMVPICCPPLLYPLLLLCFNYWQGAYTLCACHLLNV